MTATGCTCLDMDVKPGQQGGGQAGQAITGAFGREKTPRQRPGCTCLDIDVKPAAQRVAKRLRTGGQALHGVCSRWEQDHKSQIVTKIIVKGR